MVNIRRARHEDVESVASLWMEMMREHAERDSRFGLSENALSAYAEYAHGILDNSETAIFIAEVGRSRIGYVLALILENPAVFELKRYGFIGEMIVSKDERRSGIGRLLWDRAKRWFRRKGVTVVQLNVSVLNEGGKAFWRSVGFGDFLEIKWCDFDSEDRT
jgi:ribosomal protein S18 acetylase RimI-like enzyme